MPWVCHYQILLTDTERVERLKEDRALAASGRRVPKKAGQFSAPMRNEYYRKQDAESCAACLRAVHGDRVAVTITERKSAPPPQQLSLADAWPRQRNNPGKS